MEDSAGADSWFHLQMGSLGWSSLWAMEPDGNMGNWPVEDFVAAQREPEAIVEDKLGLKHLQEPR